MKEEIKDQLCADCFRFNGFLEMFVKKCNGLISKSMVEYLVQIKDFMLDVVEVLRE